MRFVGLLGLVVFLSTVSLQANPPVLISLTLATVPSGLSISGGGSQGTSPLQITVAAGTTITISVNENEYSDCTVRDHFVSWSDSGALSHSITVPGSNATITATFQTQYQLNTDVSPAGQGTVTASPTSLDDGFYDANAQVTLTAAGNSGYSFLAWTGDDTSSTNPLTVTMTAPFMVTASFGFPTTIDTSPTGLQISLDSVTYTAPRVVTFAPSSTHTIAVTSPQNASASARYRFSSWSDSGAASHSITATGGATYTASFVSQFLLTTGVQPAGGGTVTVMPTSVDGFYDIGTPVQLTPVPNYPYRLTTWLGDASGAANPLGVLMNAAKTITGQFGTSCAYSLGRLATSVVPAGDLGRVEISTGDGCPWTAASNSDWITILTGASGDKTGTVRYLVAANPLNSVRSGSLTIGDIVFPVYQSGSSCTMAVNPLVQSAQAVAASYSMQVKAPNVCSWIPVSTALWISVPGDRQVRQSSTDLPYSLASNDVTLPRVGSVEVGGQTFPILQQVSQTPQIFPGVPQLFTDVPATHPFADYIALVTARGTLRGCSAGYFCPDVPLTRADMAELTIRSLYGEFFNYAGQPYFTDVPVGHPQFRFIQKMKELGITSGCTVTTYCPGATTTRGQISVFLIRARLSLAVTDPLPFTPEPYFTDVPKTDPFFPYIQKMREAGITTGCTTTQYCPGDLVTRGQAAVFFGRAITMK